MNSKDLVDALRKQYTQPNNKALCNHLGLKYKQTAGSGLVPCIAKPAVWYAQKHTQRDDAIRVAYASGGFSMREVGEHFGLHYSVVSRVISRA